jgi:hypothetical protein
MILPIKKINRGLGDLYDASKYLFVFILFSFLKLASRKYREEKGRRLEKSTTDGVILIKIIICMLKVS